MGRCCSRPTAYRSTPITTTGVAFTARLDSKGVIGVRLLAKAQNKGNEQSPPRTCSIQQGEALCTPSTCCDQNSVLMAPSRHCALPYRNAAAQDVGYGPPRLPLPRTPVNNSGEVHPF